VTKEPLIAVIDDDEPFRTALAESLFSLGYGVRSFESAEEFVAADAVLAYDCIITDIHMPGMSGIDLKRVLTERACAVPVIMITARVDPGLEGRAAESGAVCLLRKPFESDALIAWLERAMKA
jgi:FixJ family two-component response regulator